MKLSHVEDNAVEIKGKSDIVKPPPAVISIYNNFRNEI